MTIEQIVSSVSAVTGNYSQETFFRDRRSLQIKPSGIRQKPQQYPHTAVAAILAARGFESALAPMLPPADTAFAALSRVKLAGLGELKRERRKALSRRLTKTKKGSK
tara:strand:- start:234 stop:554 length:321 start_codon:yes stop_codon:yes gene_type:complete